MELILKLHQTWLHKPYIYPYYKSYEYWGLFMYLLLWIFWNVVYCVGCVSLWWCSECLSADYLRYWLLCTGRYYTVLYGADNTLEFARFISPGYYHSLISTLFYFMYFYRYLVSYKTNILEKSKETVNVCCWDLRLYFMFCSFVISFGCLESSPEKPDFFKSGVKGANGHQGSCLNFISYYKVLKI